MPNIVLIGSQWGDEGKGKIIDVLTEKIDWVVRYQGGNNAGHTVEIGDERYILHLIPSGVLRVGRRCVIGNGVVVDPLAIADELRGLIERGIRTEGRVHISDRCHVVFPYHRALDERKEQKQPFGVRLGTTKRGIGPTYGDKAARTGLRMCDMLQPGMDAVLRQRIEEENKLMSAMDCTPLDVEAVIRDYREALAFLKPYISDTITLLNEALGRGESIMFEGAQGTMLDIDYGSYPFVTSSHATAGGACTGSGISPKKIDRIIGVLKAYTTRVGEGPFPTELKDDVGETLRSIGAEFGATTGRPRRCGWFDAVVARYSAMVNGVDCWALTKLDVLDAFKTLKICVAYEIDGRRCETVPAFVGDLQQCTPVYEEIEGWNCSTRDCKAFDDLPDKAKAYIRRIEAVTGVPAGILSLGPRRDSTLVLDETLK